MAYSLDVNALNTIIKDLGTKDLISDSFLESPLPKLGITVLRDNQPNTTIKVPIISTDIKIQSGDDCNIGASGSNITNTLNLELKPIAVRLKYCPKKHQAYFMGLENKVATNPDSLGSVEEALTYDNLNNIKYELAYNAWQSSISGTFSLEHTQTNGWLSDILETSKVSSVTFIGASYSEFNATTAIPLLKLFAVSRTQGMKAKARKGEKTIIALAPEFYDIAVQALVDDDKYNFKIVEGGGMFEVPGFGSIIVVEDVGLTGKNKIVMTYPSNFYMAVTSMEEVDGDRIVYERDNITDEIWFKYDSAIAYGVAKTQDIVMWNQPE